MHRPHSRPNSRRTSSRLVFRLWILCAVCCLAPAATAAMLDVTASPYNAAGDGITDDRAAIQAAIDDASASGGVDTVYLPEGKYLLATRAPGRGSDPVNAATALLWLPTEVTIEGAGAENSILVVGPGLNDCDPSQVPTTGGFSVLEAEDGEFIEFTVLRDFTIDGNASNNPLPDPTVNGCDHRPAMNTPSDRAFNLQGRFVHIPHGRDLLIEDCEFRNSNSRQIIHLGTNTEPETFENALIFDNVFKDHAQDSRQNDHSTIYMVATVNAQFENVIEGNVFSNSPFGHGFDVATALEIHGRWNRIESNTVSNYRLGANVIAIIGDNRNTRFLSNDFDAVSAGFHFWVYPGFEMVDTVIEGNYVEQAKVKKGDSLLDWKNVFAPVTGLKVIGNTFTSSVVGIDATNRVGRGLSFKGYLHDALVEDNTISNVECVGIRIGGPVSPSPSLGITVDAAADALSGESWINGLVIRDNLIQNPGSWGPYNAGCSVGVSILSTDTPTGYQMTGIQMVNDDGVNRIEYTSDANNHDDLLVGVRIRSVVNDSLFDGVEIAGDVTSDYATPAPDFDDVVIKHHDVTSTTDPVSQQIRACGTSTWKTSLGVKWAKSGMTCDSTSGWSIIP